MPSIQTLIRAVLVWLLLMIAESVQGALRQLLLDPQVELVLRQASVALGVAVIFAFTWIFWPWMKIRTERAAFGVGFLWVLCTGLFEVGLGRALGMSWPAILADYDLEHGGLMPLGLLAMALTPWIVGRLRSPKRPDPASTTETKAAKWP
jgi:hypothetical protein